MTILSMTATFGGLENQTLTLTKGLNLLELPNEGGKSTWCAFLRAMFYGVETRKGRETSEKNRFTPWSGKPMTGSMDLVWQGKAITLRRFQKGATPFGGFQAVYTGTEEPVPGLTADNVGRAILGFGREVFERTCFISQNGLAVGGSAELEQRLAALASSGEEDVSFSQTEARLRGWRNSLRSNRTTGSIPKLQQERDAVNATLSRLGGLENARREADDKEADLVRRQEALQTAVDDLSAKQERQYRQAYAAAHKKLTDAALQAQEDEFVRQFAPRFYLIPYLLSAILAALGMLLIVEMELWLPGVLLLAAGAALTGYALVKRYRKEQAHQAALDEAQAELNALEHWEPPKEELDALQAQLNAVTQALTTLRTRRAQGDGELRAVGDPDALRAQAADLQTRIDDEEERYAALTEAMDALTAANATLQLRFAPAVSALAGEILAKLTANRYDSITFTRAFETLAGTAGGTGKSAKLLSQGTADQSYLALRLAICLLALPDSDCAPIILDDALVTFDDKRLSLALQVLRDFAQNRQVLLFTCQGREKAALAGGGLHGTGRV